MNESTITETYWVARAATADTETGDLASIALGLRTDDTFNRIAGHYLWARDDYAVEYHFRSRTEAIAIARSQPGPPNLRPARSEIRINKVTRSTTTRIEREPDITPKEFGEH